MGMDFNTKKLKKNAFRVSKVRGMGASRIRVPGGYLNAEILGMVQEIAQTYGTGRALKLKASAWRIWRKSTKSSSPS